MYKYQVNTFNNKEMTANNNNKTVMRTRSTPAYDKQSHGITSEIHSHFFNVITTNLNAFSRSMCLSTFGIDIAKPVAGV